jgi:hypothetical protein
LLNLLFVLTSILDNPLHLAVDIDQPDMIDAKRIVLMNGLRDLGLTKIPQVHQFRGFVTQFVLPFPVFAQASKTLRKYCNPLHHACACRWHISAMNALTVHVAASALVLSGKAPIPYRATFKAVTTILMTIANNS